MSTPWRHLAQRRWFVLTADQDWAPEWATRELLDWAHSEGLPLHVFQTNPSDALDEASAQGRITRGWHPNFSAASSHGADEAAVVAHMASMLPGARTVRCHGFAESFAALGHLAEAGIAFDSNFPSAFAGHLLPSVHSTGIVRLPVWFEDDVWMRLFPDQTDLAPLKAAWDKPGLKVVNVHPVHFALNSPSMAYYDAQRPALYGSDDRGPQRYDGPGTRDVITRIVDDARAEGESWHAFEDVCDDVASLVHASPELSVVLPLAQDRTERGLTHGE